jgi:hypothetical protein
MVSATNFTLRALRLAPRHHKLTLTLEHEGTSGYRSYQLALPMDEGIKISKEQPERSHSAMNN